MELIVNSKSLSVNPKFGEVPGAPAAVIVEFVMAANAACATLASPASTFFAYTTRSAWFAVFAASAMIAMAAFFRQYSTRRCVVGCSAM